MQFRRSQKFQRLYKTEPLLTEIFGSIVPCVSYRRTYEFEFQTLGTPPFQVLLQTRRIEFLRERLKQTLREQMTGGVLRELL